MEMLHEWLGELLTAIGVMPENQTMTERLIILAFMAIAVWASYFFCHKILVKIVKRVTRRTVATWDDHLFSERVLSSVCHLVPPLVVYVMLPLAFGDMPQVLSVLGKTCFIYIVVMMLRLISAFISALYAISCEKEQTESHPLKGIYQMIKLVFICIGAIIIISIIVNKNPVVILTGLGAAAAVLTFVFKDTILGLIAGVQLSANDMLKPGDWIVASKYGANGIVKDVTLTTIKVQNWDMTITTLPPYSLISDSFQNWRGMWNSGGRRVMRSINIDMNTIRFCREDELARYKERGWLEGIDDVPQDELVNLRVFRCYLEKYLGSHPLVKNDMLMIVRQLQPTPQGLPLELYFFTAKTDWVSHESIQSAVFEHVYAMLPEFGLRMFQSPTGTDFWHGV
ncbi:MAG: mechanosensitive ion channel [Muribaculaceae bacterium]|nr:mechanosensitive ion channel [Muribaculaceae bacterium]